MAGAAALGANALASVNAHHLAGTPHIAWSTPLLGGALFVLAAFGSTPVFVLVLLLAYVAVTPVTVLSEAHFQALQEGRSRATTTSLMVVAQNIVGIGVTIGFGVLADAVGIRAAYGWAGMTMLPLAGWVWWQQRCGRSPIG